MKMQILFGRLRASGPGGGGGGRSRSLYGNRSHRLLANRSLNSFMPQSNASTSLRSLLFLYHCKIRPRHCDYLRFDIAKLRSPRWLQQSRRPFIY